jgi:hypothetical protein
MAKYTGSCHCGAVKFEAEVDLAETMVCNCSHCQMKGFIMCFVDKDTFKILQGAENLTSYKFNKGAIDHTFCKTCGVEAFSQSEAYPKMMVNVRCLDGVDVDFLKPKPFNGKDY